MTREQTFLVALAAASAVALAGCGGGGDDGGNGPTEPVNQPPEVNITNPPTGSSFEEGQGVSFEGSATDPEQGSLGGPALVWRSDLDGRLGTGIAVDAPSLSAGDHEITLEATDNQGATGSDTISIAVVSDAPSDQAELRPSGFAVLPGGTLTGEDVEVVGRVVNVGGVDAGPFDWRITLDGTVVASGRIQEGIPARDSVDLPPQDLGSFASRDIRTARVEVDTGDEVDEASEADNVAEDLLSVYPPGMDVELEFVTAVNDSTREVFETTARRWERIVPGDLLDAAVDSFDVSDCVDGGPVLRNDTIDDVRIYVRIDSIDGPGNVLGQAAPCGLRETPTETVAVGFMEFDEADIEQLREDGSLNATVEHEIAHVLGFGTLWQRQNLVDGVASGAPFYVGRQAREAFGQVGGDAFDGNPVPVEDVGGSGTALGHWSEPDLQDELMTGFIGSATDPFSIVSVEAMGDLKLATDPDEADPYTFPAARNGGLRSGPSPPRGWERAPDTPLFSIDPVTGRVEMVRPARLP